MTASSAALLVLVGVLSLVTVATSAFFNSHHHDGREYSDDFSDEWVVEVDGGTDAAQLLALRMAFEYIGEVGAVAREKYEGERLKTLTKRCLQIPGFPNHHLMRKLDYDANDRDSMELNTRSLQDETRVEENPH